MMSSGTSEYFQSPPDSLDQFLLSWPAIQTTSTEDSKRKTNGEVETEDSRNLVWSVEMEEVFLETVQDLIDRGKTRTGFKTSVWREIVCELRKVTPESFRELLNPHRVKRKYFALRSNWLMWSNLLKLPGWKLDESTGCPVADYETMESYFRANPYARKFQTRPLRYQQQLSRIFGGDRRQAFNETLALSSDEEDESRWNMKDAQVSKKPRVVDEAALQVVSMLKEAIHCRPSPVERASRLFFERDFGFDTRTKCIALDHLSNDNMAEIWFQAPDDMKQMMIQRWSAQAMMTGSF